MNLNISYSSRSIETCLVFRYFFFSLFIVITYVSIEKPSAFSQGLPSLNDPSLQLDLVTDGIQSPTSMAFLSDNIILITQKDGIISKLNLANPTIPESILELANVNSKNERGLLGIAVDNNILVDEMIGNNETGDFNVFIFVTETGYQLGQDSQGTDSNNELRNRVYKYTWDGQFLSNPKIILDLPAGPGTNHQRGKVKMGPDNQLYAIIGELQREGQLQNIKDGPVPDDSGVLFRINPLDG